MVGTAAIASGGYHLVLGGSKPVQPALVPHPQGVEEESRTEADARLTSPSTNRRMGRTDAPTRVGRPPVPSSDRRPCFRLAVLISLSGSETPGWKAATASHRHP